MKLIVCLTFFSAVESTLRDVGVFCFKPTKCLQSGTDKLAYFKARKDVDFVLESKKGKNHLIKLHNQDSLKKSGFDHNKPTRIIIHGFLQDIDSPMYNEIPSKYAKHYNMNAIKIDWGAGAITPCYDVAVHRVREVGEIVAEFLDFVIGKDNKKWDQLAVIGHSLGAHIAGFAGKNVKKGKIGTIIGLDPAAPFFNPKSPKMRLNRHDAKYVEIIHTNGQCYGMNAAIGTADFFVNGGNKQPGCWFDVCHHGRAFEYFAESIGRKNRFNAHKCSNKQSQGVLMGGEPGNLNKNVKGKLCLNTDDEEPFGLGVKGKRASMANISNIDTELTDDGEI